MIGEWNSRVAALSIANNKHNVAIACPLNPRVSDADCRRDVTWRYVSLTRGRQTTARSVVPP